MAYAGKGNTDPETNALIRLEKGTSVQNLSVWYPEQTAADPQPYPATIAGKGHNYIHNITLYNAYIGVYDHHCSSLLVRGVYGTVLSTGIDAEEGYDIPRIEEVAFDTAYWINSGLPGAPVGHHHNQRQAHRYCASKPASHPFVPPLDTPSMTFFLNIRNSTISGTDITTTAAIIAGTFSRPNPFSRISCMPFDTR